MAEGIRVRIDIAVLAYRTRMGRKSSGGAGRCGYRIHIAVSVRRDILNVLGIGVGDAFMSHGYRVRSGSLDRTGGRYLH